MKLNTLRKALAAFALIAFATACTPSATTATSGPPQTSAPAMASVAPTADEAKAMLIGKTFRGGLDLNMGDAGKGGWTMSFSDVYGNFAVTTKWGQGAGAYNDLSKGKPWSGEASAEAYTSKVEMAPNGTFTIKNYTKNHTKDGSLHTGCALQTPQKFVCGWKNLDTGATSTTAMIAE